MKRVNFITVLCGGANDTAIVENKCAFVLFVDPGDFTPIMTFFSLQDVWSQDANGIGTAIRKIFAENDLSHLVFCIVFFFLQVIVPM